MPSSEFWLSLLEQTLLRGGGWLLLLLLLAPLLRRVSAARRALGWQMAFVSLILLPMLLVWTPPLPLGHGEPLPADSMTAASTRRQSAPAPALPASRIRQEAVRPEHSIGDSVPIHGVAITMASPPAPASYRLSVIGLPSLLMLFWGIGAAFFFVRVVTGLVTLRRWGLLSMETPPEVQEAARAGADRLGFRQPVALRIAAPESRLRAPITWGIRRPIILLPASYALETNVRCRAALLHELAHVRRRDWAWLVLTQSLCALYWCVPFVWIAARRLSHETELACDDCVLSAGFSAPDYASQILEVVRTMQSENKRLPLSAMPMARLPLAEARIRAILDTTRQRQAASRSVLALAALLPALCLPLLSLRVVAAQEAHPPRFAASPSVPELPAPSSGDLTAPSLETAPLAIRTMAAEPSLPAGRRSNGEATASDPAVARMSSEPMAPRPNAAAPPDAEQSAIVWGPIVNGLQGGMRLVGARTGFAPGERIWQETYLRNRSPNAVSIDTIGGYESEGAPVITSAKGRRIKVLRFFGEGAMYKVQSPVHPGEMALVGRLAVTFHVGLHPHEPAPGLAFEAEDSALALAGPGDYRLAQELSPIDSSGKPLKMTVVTGSVPIRIDNVPAVVTLPLDRNRIADVTTAPIAWGAEHGGLQAGLILLGDRNEYFIGERVRLAVIVRSVAKTPISFWHETSFAFLDAPTVTDAEGKIRTTVRESEPAWHGLDAVRMIGVTYDMTSAPSADGPSRLRQSEIKPGQSVLGYYLTSFVIPPHWPDGKSAIGRCQLIQPVRLGLGQAEQLDTSLETGGLTVTFSDPGGNSRP